MTRKYDRDYYPKTEKECLTDEQFDRLLGVATRMSEEARRVLLILKYTGMHISVLCNPVYVEREYNRRKGQKKPFVDPNLEIIPLNKKPYFSWKRPKKVGKDAEVRLPVSKHIDFVSDLDTFIRELRSREHYSDRNYYFKLIREIGNRAGIKGVSPMTLRHTFAVWMLDEGYPEKLVQQVMNCSDRVLKRYSKYTTKRMDDLFERKGF